MKNAILLILISLVLGVSGDTIAETTFKTNNQVRITLSDTGYVIVCSSAGSVATAQDHLNQKIHCLSNGKIITVSEPSLSSMRGGQREICVTVKEN